MFLLLQETYLLQKLLDLFVLAGRAVCSFEKKNKKKQTSFYVYLIYLLCLVISVLGYDDSRIHLNEHATKAVSLCAGAADRKPDLDCSITAVLHSDRLPLCNIDDPPTHPLTHSRQRARALPVPSPVLSVYTPAVTGQLLLPACLLNLARYCERTRERKRK